MPYGYSSMLLLGEGSEATKPYNKYDKIRPHSIRSLQFDQKVRPLSFRPEKIDLFTATLPKRNLPHMKDNLPKIIRQIVPESIFGKLSFGKLSRILFFYKLDSTKWYSTNWLAPVCRIPVCRILELKKNDKTNNVGLFVIFVTGLLVYMQAPTFGI